MADLKDYYGFELSKAESPSPADDAVNVSKGLTTFTWDAPTTEGDEGWDRFGKEKWRGQTFPASSGYILSSMKLFLALQPNYDPGTVTVTLNTTTGSPPIPTSTILVTATTFEGSTLEIGGGWKEVIFATPYTITSGVTYAIVISAPSADAIIAIHWGYISPGAYDDGSYCYSDFSGSNWNAYAGWDCLFKIYGT